MRYFGIGQYPVPIEKAIKLHSRQEELFYQRVTELWKKRKWLCESLFQQECSSYSEFVCQMYGVTRDDKIGEIVMGSDTDIVHSKENTELVLLSSITEYKAVNLSYWRHSIATEQAQEKVKELLNIIEDIPELSYLEVLEYFPDFEIEIFLEKLIEEKVLRRINDCSGSRWKYFGQAMHILHFK